MNRHLLSALAAFGLVLIGYWGELLRLPDWRARLLATVLITYAVVTLGLWYVQGTLYDALRRSRPADVAALRADPGFDAFVEDRPRIGERRDWFWTSEAVALSLLAIFGPITVVPWLRTGGLTPDTPIELVDVVAMAVVVGAAVWWSRRQLRTYRYPICGGAPVRLTGETKRQLCATCQVVWRLEP